MADPFFGNLFQMGAVDPYAAAQPAPAAAPAPQQGGWLNNLSQNINDNSGLLMGLASGLVSGQPGQGVQAGLQGMAVDQRNQYLAQQRAAQQQQIAGAQAQLVPILGQERARALGADAPDVLKAWLLEQTKPKEPKYQQVGSDLVQIGPDGVTPVYRAAQEPTAQQRNLEAAGIKPGTKEYADAILGSMSGTNISINNAAERAEEAIVAADRGKTYVGLIKEGSNALNAIPQLNRMEQLVNDPNFYSGVGGPQVLQAKRAWAQVTGNPDVVTSTEAFNSLAAKDTLNAIGGSLGAQISNSDREFVERQTANLANTREGNLAIIQTRKKLEERKYQVSQLAAEYRARNGTFDEAGFQKELRTFAEENPLFPKAEQSSGGGLTPIGPNRYKWSPQ